MIKAHDSDETPPPKTSRGTLTTVIAREIVPGREAEFETWLRGVIEVASHFDGHEGATVLRPRHADDHEYVLIVRWRDYPALSAWERSAERTHWVAQADALSTSPATRWTKTGLETWFTLPVRGTAGEAGRSAPVTGPPRPAKQALVTWLAIYPLILSLNYLLVPRLDVLPVPLRTLLMTGLLVPLMTWVVMPRMTLVFWRFLYPRGPERPHGSKRR